MARETGAAGSGARGRHFGVPADRGRQASPRPAGHAAPRPHAREGAPRRHGAAAGASAGVAGCVTASHSTTGATARYAMREIPDAPVAPTSGPGAASADAPRPTPVGDTQAFSTLGSGQGAVISTRETAAEAAAAARGGARSEGAQSSRRLSAAARRNVRPRSQRLQTSRRLFVGLGVAALVVVVLVAVLVVRAVNSTAGRGDDGARVERTAVAPDESVAYDDYTYALRQGDDGTWSLVRTQGESGEPLALLELAGEPVQLVLCDGAYLIPENLPDGTWDVIAYTMGDGSVTTQLANPDGSPVTGEGRLASAALEGTELVLTDEAGAVTRVSVS